MKTKSFLLAIFLSSISIQICLAENSAKDLTQDQRRYGIAIAYLSQCAISHSDFFQAVKHFDMKYLVKMPSSQQGRERYYDQSANAAISIGKDACIVQIVGADLDQFVNPLEAALTVTGGEAKISKASGVYVGTLRKEGKQYSIQARKLDGVEKPTMSAGIWRQ